MRHNFCSECITPLSRGHDVVQRASQKGCEQKDIRTLWEQREYRERGAGKHVHFCWPTNLHVLIWGLLACYLKSNG